MSVAVVTGANSGIGMYTALHLAKMGHNVYATLRDLKTGEDLHQMAKSQNLSVKLVQLDVTDELSVQNCIAEVLTLENRIDILVNNAGIALFGTIEETSSEKVDLVFETNVFGALRLIRKILPTMRQQRSGIIINVSSVAGRVSTSCQGIYAASKFALEAISEALAQEVIIFGIRVIIIEPGFIVTPILDKALASLNFPPTSHYPQVVERSRLLFTNAKETGLSPQTVADTIAEAIHTKEPKIRYVVGESASAFLNGRAQMSDEEWVSMGITN